MWSSQQIVGLTTFTLPGCANHTLDIRKYKMPNEKKRHHYIPQYYLKGFTASPTTEEICVYERRRQPFCTGIAGVAFQNHFYSVVDSEGVRDSNTLENYLADEIEKPAKPVIESLRRGQMITAPEKQALARYISTLLTRVPAHRERLKALYPGVVASLSAEIEEELSQLAIEEPDQSRLVEEQRAKIQQVLDGYRNGMPDHYNTQAVSSKYAAVIGDMTWVFLTTQGKFHFLTSDNPVFFFEGMGLVGGDVPRDHPELSFPISKSITLWATWRPYSEGFLPVEENFVREINVRTVSTAMRYVYYYTQADWVTRLINKDPSKYKLNRIVLK